MALAIPGRFLLHGARERLLQVDTRLIRQTDQNKKHIGHFHGQVGFLLSTRFETLLAELTCHQARYFAEWRGEKAAIDFSNSYLISELALQRIARVGGAGGAAFVSRADGSGTHLKERQLWEEAGISPQGDWYRETGQGMGNTLTIANEMGAYTLSDQGTYLSRREGLDLFVMSSGGALLLNPYGIIAVNPALHPRVERDLAEKLIEYLTSHQTQERIAAFGRDLYGEPLFYPDSEAWRAEQ